MFCNSSSSVFIAVNAIVISELDDLLASKFCKDFTDAYKGIKYSASSGNLPTTLSL